MNITRWPILKSDWLYSLQPKMEKLYTVSSKKTWSWLWSDRELLIAKFRLILKRVGKTCRLFKYDLSQIPYYTVEVMNRFKWLDLVDRLPEELWVEVHNIVREVMTKTIPKKKKCKKANWLPAEALQRAEKRREARKGKIYSLECRVLENSKENKESLLQWQMQKNKGKQ